MHVVIRFRSWYYIVQVSSDVQNDALSEFEMRGLRKQKAFFYLSQDIGVKNVGEQKMFYSFLKY